MRMMKHSLSALAIALISTSMMVTATAGERKEMSGDKLFEYHGCLNCHGAMGKNPITKKVPEIGGKEADYIYTEATKILAGERKTEEAMLMHSALAYQSSCDYPPTDAELKKIGEWLAAQ